MVAKLVRERSNSSDGSEVSLEKQLLLQGITEDDVLILVGSQGSVDSTSSRGI